MSPLPARLAVAALALVLAAPAVAQPPRADARTFREAAAYSRRHGGDALLVLRGDSVVLEEYHNGWRAEQPHFLASGTKSFVCAIAAAAVGDSLLRLDERVAATVPEIGTSAHSAPMTVRQLLQLVGGLDPANQTVDGSDPPNRYSAARFRSVHARPGERWAYGPTPFDLFGEVMRRKLAATGEDPLAYLERRVFRPIGLSYGQWLRDGAGNPLFSSGARLTAREWLKFGRLVRDGGRWDGRAVLPAEVLRECFVGSAARPDYGLAFWLRAPDSALPEDLVFALGAAGQLLVVVPSQGLVVVRFGREHAEFRVFQLLGRLFGVDAAAPRAPGGPER
ncbi:MAG TPA: serine hydrolase domain-containing protein [Longimicrobiaceae bacterium]|nr:serine hydrolase domain-containing protein [Longimicrobiaceae bacterium]